jgi:geranylgeranyl pyrophosphate synthase
MMVDYNLDTLQYIRTPHKIKAYELIQDNLNLVERRLVTEQPGQHRLLTDAAVQLFQAGGKRIRAAICLLAAEIFEADLEKTLSLAAGVEMLHTATLVHDDLIDDSALRRGKSTLNTGQNAKFSVLIGDYFFARAANLVAETNNVAIMNQFAETLATILNGEVIQQFSRWQMDRQGYYDRIYAKTGAMFVLAAKSAATLGGADEDGLLALEKYGRYTGIAFQIIDDVLDFSGNQSQLGKPVGSDLQEGLLTLPVLLYADKYPNDPNINLLLEVKDGNHPAATSLIASIQDSGVLDDAIDQARDLISDGQRAIKHVPYSAYTEALSSLADSVVERKT